MPVITIMGLMMSVLFPASIINFAQHDSANQIGCTLIDRNRPAQFISYVDISESASDVRLRLRNNTSCTIIVQTDDVYPTRLNRLPNNGVGIEQVTTSQDGVRLPLHYLIQDTHRQRAPKPAYGWGDSVFTYEVLAGQSVIFTVPLIHFRRRFDIAVPFNYSWEGNTSIAMGVGGVTHRVYFLAGDLPKKSLRE